MILIIGSEEEAHSRWVYNRLVEKGIETDYFDSRKYPDNLMISYSPNNNDGYFIIDGKKLKYSDIQGIYWRWYYGISQLNSSDNFEREMVFRERTSALNSIFAGINCNWVNSYNAIELHKTKIFQLNIMKKNNIRIPETLITNDENALIEFYEKHNKNVIYKPIRGGAFTQKLTDEDLRKEQLDTLKTSPIQLQEFIDGTDIRVMAMGDKIFSAELKTDKIDFRTDTNAIPTPIEIPDNVKDDCKKVLNLLDLKYSGIDIRRNSQGEYVFIEANPAPMFIFFEQKTNYPITETLIELLTK